MTKNQIKAELRRSACEDAYPSVCIKQYAWNAQMKWRPDTGTKVFHSTDAARVFFLLVAEAL